MNNKVNISKRIIALVLTLSMLFGGVVSVSAAEEYTSGDYTYTVTDGKAKITSYPETAKGAVEIPSKLGGYPVTEIGAYSFYACTLITEVTIPNTVTSIGNYAFAYCTTLTTVEIPASVTSIGTNAFKYSDNVVIEGRKDSYVNEYADKNGIDFVEVKFDDFSYSDTWNFANSELSFIGEEDNYFIPEERYREVFGQTYVDNVEIPTDWGGNCFGMSATTILFHAGLLDWLDYAALYDEDFTTVNRYYNTLRWQKPSWSFSRYYYAASDYNTVVTKLIERYQIIQESATSYGYGDFSTANEVDGNYYTFGSETTTGTLISRSYVHMTSGNYIQNIFNTLIASEEPTSVGLRSRSGGHAIVVRTDKVPEDMGDGWWRFYVYDPNDPLLPNDYLDGKNLLPSYINSLIDDGGDRYIELNPTENKFRYKGFVNSDGEATEYWGCDENGDVLYRTLQATVDGITYRETVPEYMVIRDLAACLPTSFNGTEPWESEDSETIVSVTEDQSFKIFDSKNNLIAVVSNGECVVLDSEKAQYMSDTNVLNEGERVKSGRLNLKTDDFNISFFEGNIDCIGDDSVISFNASSDKPINISVNGDTHKIIVEAEESVDIEAKVCNVNNSDSYETAYIEGEISEGETIGLSVNRRGIMSAESDISDSNLVVSCKTEDAAADIGSINDCENVDIRDIESEDEGEEISCDIIASEIDLVYKSTHNLVIVPDAKNIIWSSSDESVAKVDSNGKVTAVGTGTATITATVEGTDISDTCKVTVSYAWWQWIIRILLLGFLWY